MAGHLAPGVVRRAGLLGPDVTCMWACPVLAHLCQAKIYRRRAKAKRGVHILEVQDDVAQFQHSAGLGTRHPGLFTCTHFTLAGTYPTQQRQLGTL